MWKAVSEFVGFCLLLVLLTVLISAFVLRLLWFACLDSLRRPKRSATQSGWSAEGTLNRESDARPRMSSLLNRSGG